MESGQVEVKGIQFVFSGALTAATIYLNAIMIPVIVLIAFMVLDYITGLVRAWKTHELSSEIGIIGIIKKICYMILVCVAMGVDYLVYSGLVAVNITVPYNLWFGLIVTIWLIINEMISILENLSEIGVPIPEFLKKIVNRLEKTVDKEGEIQADEKRN